MSVAEDLKSDELPSMKSFDQLQNERKEYKNKYLRKRMAYLFDLLNTLFVETERKNTNELLFPQKSRDVRNDKAEFEYDQITCTWNMPSSGMAELEDKKNGITLKFSKDEWLVVERKLRERNMQIGWDPDLKGLLVEFACN